MFNYNEDLIYFIKREGTSRNPYSSMEENVYISHEKAFLAEIPVYAFKVVAKIGSTTLTEVSRLEDVRSTNQYYVNYKQGIVYFHSTRNSNLVNLTYKGQGVLLYPASRIYIDSDSDLDVVRTLKDLISDGGGGGSAPVQNTHTHVNKTVLDGFSIVNGRLQHNVASIGSVESINGMTGVITINASSIGAYTKNEVDSIITGVNNNIGNRISNSEKGVAGGIARLNANGKVVDATGSEVEGKVTSVNGQIGAITGLETTNSADSKLSNKVDKVAGKQLSTNDFTNIYKAKLDELDNRIDELVGLIEDIGEGGDGGGDIDGGIF